VLVSAAAVLMVIPAGAGEYRATSEPGQLEVEVLTGEWIDLNRDGREVPWKIYLPKEATTPAPVVIWSHGGGGSREGAEYLGRHLASHGYAAVHIQHHGSDIEVLRRAGGRQGLLDALQGNQGATVQRFKDVPFAVDRIDAMNREGPLAGRLDTTSIGMSGHSFGAITTLAVAGQKARAFGRRFAVPAFKAAFAMSPSPPRDGTPPEEAFSDLLMPVFHLTGTADASPLADFEPEQRQVPFRSNASVDQYLLVLENGVHATFSGRTSMPGGRDIAYPGIERHHELIKIAALAFWDAYLKGDATALAWLQDGGYAAAVGDAGTFDFKPAACSEE
jgi:predicted dienelactone hydrolase